jgi:transcriptional regulator with XRE-family HTH domain
VRTIGYSFFMRRDMNRYTSLTIEDMERGIKREMLRIIALNIKSARVRQKMSIEKAAEIAGISPTYWSEIERQLKTPGSLTLIKILKALNMPPCGIIPADNCPMTGGDGDAVRRMLMNNGEKDIKKVVRMLEIFFE